MTTCIIFGGTGYIGTLLAEYVIQEKLFDRVVLADIVQPRATMLPGVSFREVDVRKPIPLDLAEEAPAWIFNLAAVHREPGHDALEYFDTNLAGARHVSEYADATGCANIYFTSSISVYGPTSGPTDESSPICPISPYGGSKYPAELIHKAWQERKPGRRLIIVRPGVVYGPRDPGNIGRMVAAIKKGYFAFPGSVDVRKSYAYVFGLLESIKFLMARPDPVVVYNYVETPTETLGEIADHVKTAVGSKAPVLSIPTWVLLPAAHLVQLMFGAKNPVHPVRVKKAGMSTHIVPGVLLSMGFPFRYQFKDSLVHWQRISPEDFS